jgi:flavodoxin I
MNALVITFSKFGHTRMLGQAIAECLNADGNAQSISMDEIDITTLADADLVIMGSPTHKMNLPEAVRPVLDLLPKRSLRGVSIAAFDTSYRMNAILARFTAAKKLDRKLRKLGGKRIAPPETFFVAEREGPLEEGELERAQAWAVQIRKQL